MKLPSWGGYWFWDNEKQTIVMRPKDGDYLDIRQTERVAYTILNMMSDEWIIADSDNCPVLGGEARFSFGEAIKYMKRGLRVARENWNGKNQYVFLADEVEFHANADLSAFDDTLVDVCPVFVIKTADNVFQPGWLATQSDMLAEDWFIYEEE